MPLLICHQLQPQERPSQSQSATNSADCLIFHTWLSLSVKLDNCFNIPDMPPQMQNTPYHWYTKYSSISHITCVLFLDSLLSSCTKVCLSWKFRLSNRWQRKFGWLRMTLAIIRFPRRLKRKKLRLSDRAFSLTGDCINMPGPKSNGKGFSSSSPLLHKVILIKSKKVTFWIQAITQNAFFHLAFLSFISF